MRALVLLAVAGAAVVAGCSADSGDVQSRLLASLRKEHKETSKVTCPKADDLAAGTELRCDARIGEATIPIVVTFTSKSRFTYVNTSNVVTKADLEGRIRSELGDAGVALTGADCGARQLYAVREAPQAVCNATLSDASTFAVTLTATDPDTIHAAPTRPHILLKAAALTVAAELAKSPGGAGTTVECAPTGLFLGDVGQTTTCTAKLATGATLPVTLTLKDGAGTFAYDV